MKTETYNFSPADIELSEAKVWIDLYNAAPPGFINKFNLKLIQIDDVTLTLCEKIPFIHFNAVSGIGLTQPATETMIDEIIKIYRDNKIDNFYFHITPYSQPEELTGWLSKRGFSIKGSWERIFRNSQIDDLHTNDYKSGFIIEKVTAGSALKWAEYLDSVYGLPTKPWLLELINRPGWHHYLLKKEDGIAAVRSMFIQQDRMAWFGIDAPVPGLMTLDFEPDYILCRAMIPDGLKLGAKTFTADIEAPFELKNSAAYKNFGKLNFQYLYLRQNYG